MDDESLYRQLRAGDQSALAELVRRYHSPLYRFLCRYTGDAALADDLTQETFIRLLTHQGAPPTRFRAWIYAIARNLARDQFKSAHHRRERSADLDEDTDRIAHDETRTSDERDDVIRVLAFLSPDHREVLILRFYHDLKLDEIAEVTGTPPGTVKSRLFHALRQVKGFLAITEVMRD